jgi:hypothetical protein
MHQRNLPAVRLSVLVAAIALFQGSQALAQSPFGPMAMQPPTYGPPTDTNLLGYQIRTWTAESFNIDVQVPTAQLQKVLPVGYLAVDSAAPGTALMRLFFSFQEEFALSTGVPGYPAGTYGPYDEAGAAVIVWNITAQTWEVLIVEALTSTPEATDFLNAVFGPGSYRTGDIKLAVKDDLAQLHLKATVQDPASSFRIGVSVTTEDQITGQPRGAAPAAPLRYVNFGVTPQLPNAQIWFGTQSEVRSIPTTTDVVLDNTVVRLPGGKVSIAAIQPTQLFLLNAEGFVKFR